MVWILAAYRKLMIRVPATVRGLPLSSINQRHLISESFLFCFRYDSLMLMLKMQIKLQAVKSVFYIYPFDQLLEIVPRTFGIGLSHLAGLFAGTSLPINRLTLPRFHSLKIINTFFFSYL